MEATFEFSCKGIIVQDNHFLALYKEKDGLWFYDLPGGRLELGESPEETLVREIREELGIGVQPMKLVDTWHIVKHQYQVVGLLYLCHANSKDIILSQEHDRYEWIPIEEAAHLVHNRVFLDQEHPWNRLFVNRMMYWNWEKILDDKLMFITLNH
ncbi:NUDIX domain-containing protein [Vallitalea pronyensis]|uniref:NUDIX domain-containing protein n=1 Tax=Vallitalea pronyensis TaxID=1348613 RepID=A0A8J8SHF5_9FIRM|nr:NUDIX domain-containing protein [Vallitalea pronyensis]QUI23382.1 NUDIX domain-containing protein [Vallitalea pronyensis]